jgi:ribosomal protein S18 acetylase RimI-like enzyme
VTIEIRMLRSGDDALLDTVAPDLFDNPVDRRLTAEFLADPRHHLSVAIDDGQIVGFASGVHYLHPDKLPELFVNEVAVAPSRRRLGIGRAVLRGLLDHGTALGCHQAWVLTDHMNQAAMQLYASLGGAEHPTPAAMFEFQLESAR